MNVSKFHQASSEILLLISENLYHEHTPSLLAFACASKRCYSAAAPFLFRVVKLYAIDRKRLAQDVQRWTEILERSGAFKYVQCLIIESTYSHSVWEKFKISAAEQVDDDYCLNDNPQRFHSPVVLGGNEEWKPLADLIRRFPAIKDIIYECGSQFPPCILEILHGFHPCCRLHLNTFQMHSLNAPMTDQYEYKLATSPCLYSLSLEYDEGGGYDTEGRPNYQVESVMRLAGGLAPNLKRVYIRHISPAASLDDYGPPWRPWKGFTQDDGATSSSQGALTCLQLFSYLDLSDTTFRNWDKLVDFSLLRVLRIHSNMDAEAVEYISDCSFPSLVTLELRMTPQNGGSRYPNGYAELISMFLNNLRPLTTLNIRGWHPEMGLGFLFHHGTKLRRLSLVPCRTQRLTIDNFSQISEWCQSIEELAVHVARDEGSPNESAVYRKIGSLPRLQSLSLGLDASFESALGEQIDDDEDSDTEPLDDPSFDDFERRLTNIRVGNASLKARQGHVRRALINSAIDRHLACAIFQEVSSGKKPNASLPLEKLTAKVITGGAYMSQFNEVIDELGKSWFVERNPHCDKRYEITAREIPRDLITDNYGTPLARWMEPIFRRVWPAKSENGDWRNDWFGLPIGHTHET